MKWYALRHDEGKWNKASFPGDGGGTVQDKGLGVEIPYPREIPWRDILKSFGNFKGIHTCHHCATP